MKKTIDIVILVVMGIAIIGGAIFASHIPIKWFEFGSFMVLLVVAIIAQRIITKKELQSSSMNRYSISNFIQYLENLQINATAILSTRDKIQNDSITDKYENTINNLLVQFDDYHLSLNHQLDITTYTTVLSLYGTAERYINRGYSAAIDGYIGESLKSIKIAIESLDATITELKNYKK